MELREKILLKVTELFMRYGIKSISMDDISNQMGISKKTLYQFVDNKKDLIQKIFERHIKEELEAMKVIVNESENAVEEIVRIAQYVTQLLREMSPKTLYDLQKYYRSIWDMMEALHQQHIFAIIKKNIERGIKEDLYRGDLNPDIVAKLYVGKNSLIVDEKLFPLKDYNTEKLFKEHIKYHIYGIASKKGLRLLEKHTKQKI